MARTSKKLSDFDYVVGIDEAGRGPIAGPVAVGFVLMSYEQFLHPESILSRLPLGVDSKKMSVRTRDYWHGELKRAKREAEVDYKVSFASHTQIDSAGITVIIHETISETLKNFELKPKRTLILLDGSLKAPKEYHYQETIIEGDEKEPIIALASVAAKVERDRKMKLLAKKYPEYQFDQHKGYGTRAHYDAINKYGISPIHRRTFIKG